MNNDLKKNIELLEREGLTVVMLAFNNQPQLIISLEETHIAKSEAREVIAYLRDKMKLKIAMITGDN